VIYVEKWRTRARDIENGQRDECVVTIIVVNQYYNAYVCRVKCEICAFCFFCFSRETLWTGIFFPIFRQKKKNTRKTRCYNEFAKND